MGQRRATLFAVGLAICVALGLLVLFALRAGDPRISDPVAVDVQGGGKSLTVVIDRCLSLRVTEVTVVASAKDGEGSSVVLWDYVPQGGEYVFSTSSAAGAQARTAFKGLAAAPPKDVLVARVYYVQSSAPTEFANRDNLLSVFTPIPSAAQRIRFDSLSTRTCQ